MQARSFFVPADMISLNSTTQSQREKENKLGNDFPFLPLCLQESASVYVRSLLVAVRVCPAPFENDSARNGRVRNSNPPSHSRPPIASRPPRIAVKSSRAYPASLCDLIETRGAKTRVSTLRGGNRRSNWIQPRRSEKRSRRHGMGHYFALPSLRLER